ncbi:unnamed protein product, partial [Ixodes persulcatus]
THIHPHTHIHRQSPVTHFISLRILGFPGRYQLLSARTEPRKVSAAVLVSRPTRAKPTAAAVRHFRRSPGNFVVPRGVRFVCCSPRVALQSSGVVPVSAAPLTFDQLTFGSCFFGAEALPAGRRKTSLGSASPPSAE